MGFQRVRYDSVSGQQGTTQKVDSAFLDRSVKANLTTDAAEHADEGVRFAQSRASYVITGGFLYLSELRFSCL